MKRKHFVKTIGLSAMLFPMVKTYGYSFKAENEQLDKALVEKFVNVSHSKMDVVKEMLEEHPTLLNAAHDWKNGDFETGLGAASHVGHKDLVKYFLDKGAQANIFTAALFGKMEILKPMLEFNPALINAKGPHGFTLLHHAEKGGKEAEAVKEYLISLGLTETRFDLF